MWLWGPTLNLVRSVQPLLRLLDQNSQTNKHAKFIFIDQFQCCPIQTKKYKDILMLFTFVLYPELSLPTYFQ